MIEPEDLIFPDTATHPSTFVTSQSAVHSIVSKLKALESTPVIGAFDANHLQQIHAHIFEGMVPWAGKLREPQSPSFISSLDMLFDRLARENRLKGLDGDEWSKRSTKYLSELSIIEPFLDGNELASLEFFRQLASENNMTLRCVNGMSEPTSDELQSQLQRTQSNNLRRILMLAVDPCPTVRPSRVLGSRNISELIVSR